MVYCRALALGTPSQTTRHMGLKNTLLGLLLLASACSPASFVWVTEHPDRPAPLAEDPIGAGDTLAVLVEGQTDLSGDFQLDDYGTYTHPMLGKLTLRGLSAAQAQKRIAEKLRGKVLDPLVSVSVIHRALFVSVFGEVSSPGVYPMRIGENVLEALARAGGVTAFAHDDRIYVMGPTLPTRVRLRYESLIAGDPKTLGFTLRDGDIVVVE